MTRAGFVVRRSSGTQSKSGMTWLYSPSLSVPRTALAESLGGERRPTSVLGVKQAAIDGRRFGFSPLSGQLPWLQANTARRFISTSLGQIPQLKNVVPWPARAPRSRSSKGQCTENTQRGQRECRRLRDGCNPSFGLTQRIASQPATVRPSAESPYAVSRRQSATLLTPSANNTLLRLTRPVSAVQTTPPPAVHRQR